MGEQFTHADLAVDGDGPRVLRRGLTEIRRSSRSSNNSATSSTTSGPLSGRTVR